MCAVRAGRAKILGDPRLTIGVALACAEFAFGNGHPACRSCVVGDRVR